MTTKMQEDIVDWLQQHGNGAFSKLQLHFVRTGRSQEFRPAIEALLEAGRVAIIGDAVKLIDK
ncbi:hypothetical protein [Burkholderia glumae]|uniref:Uncharacterized protein n=1 Tax=Burkholderia glumae TaxID=337 RepID=A0AAQ0BW21_BURGL|nr:hypothetical protein [Burkholderia glumae]AJY62301.1 hypothetical protein KS03_5803 [Burkholderia glumae LMG 2196 = ATCC 33617]PNK93259.1 hypothetical protein CEQ24_030370 [Burkholderia glumae]QPQ94721.1 hypothetical protein I6H06_28590 [Burkholderia glumae]QQM89414.1 hypothetical protein I6G78_01380 [Burkholderia glumae]UVS88340.1 hypothetical protein EFP17_00040 [Burkholderia glumae]